MSVWLAVRVLEVLCALVIVAGALAGAREMWRQRGYEAAWRDHQRGRRPR